MCTERHCELEHVSTKQYKYFVPNHSKIAQPLIELTKKSVPFHWGETQFKAFKTLKTLMCGHPVLKQPNYTKPFFLSTDASAYGVGAILSQEGEINPCMQKPTQQPIAYYSTTFTPTKRNYDIYISKMSVYYPGFHWFSQISRFPETWNLETWISTNTDTN
jgi:RNase H-like domain found in reverse transcriptase